MASVEHNVFPPLPNEMLRNGDPGSSSPLGKTAGNVHPPNAMIHAGIPNNGFMPMTKQASQVKGSNEDLKFNVANAKMPQPPSVVDPGKGAIPVNPFQSSGGKASQFPVSAMGRAK